jgi:ribulose 1,5-bisphosphate synthetase/thiazole synthase
MTIRLLRFSLNLPKASKASPDHAHERYDVIILGAGPAGRMPAESQNDSGIRILVLVPIAGP